MTVAIARPSRACARRVQPRLKLINSLLRAPQARVALCFRKALRDNPCSLFWVIKGEHRVVQANCHRRNLELVDSRRRNALQTPRQIVAEQAGGTTLKRRQIASGG